jgi:hypothetical protein
LHHIILAKNWLGYILVVFWATFWVFSPQAHPVTLVFKRAFLSGGVVLLP